VGDAKADGEGSAVGVSVGAAVAVDVGVSVAVDVGAAVAVDVGVGVGVREGVRVGVRVGVRDGVGDWVAVDVAVAVGLGVEVGAGDVDVAAGRDVLDGCRAGRSVRAGAVVAAETACVGAAGAPEPDSRRGRAIQPRMARTTTTEAPTASITHWGMRRRGAPQVAQALLVPVFTVPHCRQRTRPAGGRVLPHPGQMRCPSCIAMPQWGQVLARSFASTLVPSSGSRLCLGRARRQMSGSNDGFMRRCHKGW